MKQNKIVYCFLVVYMLIGGVMGLIKGIVPNMEWLNYRYLLGLGSTEVASIPIYIVYYGLVMAVLEIVSASLLLIRKRVGIIFALLTLCLNAIVCVVVIIMGDIVAFASLTIRLLGIYVLLIAKNEVFKKDYHN